MRPIPIATATTIAKMILEGNGGGEVPHPKIEHNHVVPVEVVVAIPVSVEEEV